MQKAILFFLNICTSVAFSQSGFQKVFFANHAYCISKQSSDGSFAVSIPRDSVFMRLDQVGDLLNSHSYNFAITDFKEDGNNGFVTGGNSNGIYTSDAVMASLDSSLIASWINHLPSSASGSNILKTEILPGGNILFLVFDDAYGLSNSYTFSLRDAAGNSIHDFYKRADDFILSGDKYIVSAYTNIYSNTLEIWKSDTMGNIQWTRTFEDPLPYMKYYTAGSITEDVDLNFIVGGHYTEYPGPSQQKLFMKINSSNGDTLFTKRFGNGNFMRLIPVSSGGYAAIGSDSTGTIELTRIDNNLNVQWTKHFSVLTSSESVYFEECTDGGFLISGYTFDIIQSIFPYLIKTDSLGNTAPFNSIATTPSEDRSVIFYPNPFHNTTELLIRNFSSSGINKLMIFDVCGKEIFSQEIFSVKEKINFNSKPGIYFYRVTSMNSGMFTGRIVAY